MKYPHSWLTKKAHKKVFLREFGVFTTEKIKKGEKVIVFGGYVMTSIQFDSLSKELKHFPFQIDDNLYFGLSKSSEIEEADYLNHSCDPNCGFSGEIIVTAMRDIEKGEQITIDYAMCSSNEKSLGMKDCSCGSDFCRKKIKANDWKIKDLQKRYKGFFEPFLERKIKNI